jgi:hypothetical protein
VEGEEPLKPGSSAQPAEEATASDQSRATTTAPAIPVDLARVQHGIAPASIEDLAESLAGLVRAAPGAAVIRSMTLIGVEQLERERERTERERERADDLQHRFGQEQQDHAVTKNDLKHAGERTAAQQMLQIVGSAFIGFGLSELITTWWGASYLVIGTAMATVGSLPIIMLLPWLRRRP